jgi:hypothetical protein
MARVSDKVTTRSLKDRASLLKSRRRRQGHMSNFSQERINSSPQLVFRRQKNHASSALQFVNDRLSVKANDKSSQGSSFSGFGASSFPGNVSKKELVFLSLGGEDRGT